MKKPFNDTAIVIGGGWSGLSAAVTLSAAGVPVTLLEAADFLGGRARSVPWNGLTIDNGQHLMIGAYTEMRQLLNTIGVTEAQCFERQALHLQIHDPHWPTLQLSSHGWLPWRLNIAYHLWLSTDWKSLMAVRRLQSSLPQQASEYNKTVLQWMTETRQPERLVQQLWLPLCLATMNTPIEQASARIFATVLQLGLFQERGASDLLLPKQPLGDILPAPAANFIVTHGGKIEYQQRAESLLIEQNKVVGIKTRKGNIYPAKNVIVALPPAAAKSLIAPWVDLPATHSFPICTVYLQYRQPVSMSEKIVGLSNCLAQWVFDRRDLAIGLIAVVISGPGDHEAWSRDALIAHISQVLHQHLPNWPPPNHITAAEVIREKRATFSCTPNENSLRPHTDTTINRLFLASDWVKNTYPATLEGAIFNGRIAAQALLAEMLH